MAGVKVCALMVAVLCPWACGSPAGPRVSIDDEAAPLVDAWAEAIGGRAQLDRIEVVHTRGVYRRGGLAGSFESWTTASGQSRWVQELGPTRTIEVFDGASGWELDSNGDVRALAGLELDHQLLATFLDSHSMFLCDRKPGAVSLDAGGALLIAPAGTHLTARYTFDPTSHLPDTRIVTTPDRSITTRLSDWRAVDGVRFAFRRETRPDLGDPSMIEVTSIDFRPPPPGAFARPPAGATDVTFTRPAPITLPLDVHGSGLAFVSGRIGGSPPLAFLIDTGFSESVIESARLAELGLQTTGTFARVGVAHEDSGGYVAGVRFELDGVAVGPQLVSSADLSPHARTLGRAVDGVLGYDFLSRFVVELDLAGGTLRLHPPGSYRPPAGAAELRLDLENRITNLEVMLVVPDRAPIPGRFTLDSGCACALSITSGFDDEHGLAAALSATPARSAGGRTGLVATLPALRLGTLETAEVPISFPQDRVGAMTWRSFAGLLGVRVLRRFVVVLDYGGQRLWLVPSKSADDAPAR